MSRWRRTAAVVPGIGPRAIRNARWLGQRPPYVCMIPSWRLDGDALDCMFAEIRERPVARHARYED
jgi:hypothetical protein